MATADVHDNKYWVDECFGVDFTPERTAELVDALAGVADLTSKIAYEGFSADLIRQLTLECAGAAGRKMIGDLISLITLFLVRGANTKKLSDAVLGRYHDNGIHQEMHRLISIYKVAEKPAGSRRTITLPRLSLSFPTASLKITADLLITSREKTPEEWFYSCNALPYLLEEGGAHWKQHSDMQTELSRRFSEGKTQKVTDPGRFARFALKTSGYTQVAKNKLLKELEDAFAFAHTGHVGRDEYNRWARLQQLPAAAVTQMSAEEKKKYQKEQREKEKAEREEAEKRRLDALKAGHA